jgi:phosphate transport system permease protein
MERTDNKRGPRQRLDRAFQGTALACGMLVLLVMGGILVSLAMASRPSIEKFGWRFLIANEWNPGDGVMEFGAAASIYGTLVSTAIAMLLATPLGFAIALFLVELSPPRLGRLVGPAIELLAAIPSIIFGMWGFFVLRPLMRDHVEPLLGGALGGLPLFQGPPMGIGILTAGIVLAIMVLPFISAVMRDVLQMVPPVLKEAAHGMGSTRWEVTRHVMVRYGIRGLAGASFLGLGRAIGETMAVTYVIGNNHDISASLFAAGTSIASTLANEFAEASDRAYQSALVELGLVLFLLTLGIQIVAHVWLKRLAQRMGAAG